MTNSVEQSVRKRLAAAVVTIYAASTVVGNLPENPGYNGVVLLIDDEEALRIERDLDEAAADIGKACMEYTALIQSQADEIARLREALTLVDKQVPEDFDVASDGAVLIALDNAEVKFIRRALDPSTN